MVYGGQIVVVNLISFIFVIIALKIKIIDFGRIGTTIKTYQSPKSVKIFLFFKLFSFLH